MKFKILVVDDEQDIVSTIVRYMKLSGYDIEGVTSPIKAMEMIEKGDYKVVITDIVMPEMSGMDLIKEIKRIDGIIQIIVITGYVTVNNLITCLRRGANECLFKPFQDMEIVRNAVDDSLNKLERWHAAIRELQKKK